MTKETKNMIQFSVMMGEILTCIRYIDQIGYTHKVFFPERVLLGTAVGLIIYVLVAALFYLIDRCFMAAGEALQFKAYLKMKLDLSAGRRAVAGIAIVVCAQFLNELSVFLSLNLPWRMVTTALVSAAIGYVLARCLRPCAEPGC